MCCSFVMKTNRFSVTGQIFGEKKYLRAAEKCGEVIWNRGLLRKGYGLCHGSAGNGYAFLALYKATKKDMYLFQATKVCCLIIVTNIN